MIKNFDLSTWTQFSNRKNSQSYVSADKKWMVKFPTEMSARDDGGIEKEREFTTRALLVGIKTPKVGETVELPDGRRGLIYEMIENKSSIARAIANNPDKLEHYMKMFAEAAFDMHSHTCDPKEFDDMQERVRKNAIKNKIFKPEYEEIVLKLVDSTEKTNNFAHGDFQPSNFITDGTNVYTIDLGSMACGNPIFDVGVFYCFLLNVPERWSEMIFHCDYKLHKPMWDCFLKYYFKANSDKAKEDITRRVQKYSLVSYCELFEYIHFPDHILDEYRKCVDEHFKLFFKDEIK